MNCLLVNQFATPGLGSLMGRRIVAGTIQLTLAVAGFLCVIAWFVQILVKTYRETAGYAPLPNSFSWTGELGAILFIASWVLAWFTSISLLRESKNTEPPPLHPLPPKLDGSS